jgi:hypothetical protein
MRKLELASKQLFIAFFVGTTILTMCGCDNIPKPPKSFEPFTYKAKNGGCIVYFRDEKDSTVVTLLNASDSPTGIMIDGSTVLVPKCSSWGVCILIGSLDRFISELNENKTPEVMLLSSTITDKDISSLSGLNNVNRLILTFCQNMSDASLADIQNVKTLTRLFLPAKCNITENGLITFQKNRPDVKVFRTEFASITEALRNVKN